MDLKSIGATRVGSNPAGFTKFSHVLSNVLPVPKSGLIYSESVNGCTRLASGEEAFDSSEEVHITAPSFNGKRAASEAVNSRSSRGGASN